MILGISGKKQHGKDLTAEIICELLPYHNFKVRKFAEPIKKIVSILTGYTVTELENEVVKSVDLGEHWGGKTVRSLLQIIGTEAGRELIHPDVWINSLFRNYQDSENWIVSDVRFPNEVNRILELGGKVIRVERPSIKTISDHESETSLDNYEQFHHIFINDGTKDELKKDIKYWLSKQNF